MSEDQTQQQETAMRIRVSDNVPISSIEESPFNPRRTFDDMRDLEASIARDGILSPILVRKTDQGAFQIVAGARRYRAALKVGIRHLRVNELVDCTDEKARELQIVENTQRADVHPMEEAEAFEQLLGLFAKKFEDPFLEIAKRIGKPRAHVVRRMVLVDLPANARKAYRAGQITMDVAVAIARIPVKSMRQEAATTILDFARAPYESLQLIRDQYMLQLSTASFDRKDTELFKGAVACGACPKRTGNQVDLFGDVAGKDLCTDPVCFKKKTDASWIKESSAARENGVRVIEGDEAKQVFYSNGQIMHRVPLIDPDEKNYEKLGGATWKKALKGSAPTPILARTPDGQVKTLWDAREAMRVLNEVNPRLANKSAATGKREALDAKEERRKAKLERAAVVLATEALLDTKQHASFSEMNFLARVVPVFLEEARYEFAQDTAKRRGFRSIKSMIEDSTENGLRSILLEAFIGAIGDWKRPDAIKKLCKALDLDFTQFKKQANEAAASTQGAKS